MANHTYAIGVDTQNSIESGKTVLGIEFGSTRIKAVLIGEDHTPIASGSHEWENRYENGIWTYSLEDVWTGLQESYRNLCNEVLEKYHTPLQTIGAIGFSAMMHGYVAFDKNGNLLTKAIEVGTGQSVVFTYDPIHFGPHQPAANSLGSFSYDKRGNQTGAPGRIGPGGLPPTSFPRLP